MYLDDFLVAHQNPNILRIQVVYALQVLAYLGWQVNILKSQLCPTQKLVNLGILWDSGGQRISLPIKKIMSLSNRLERLILHPVWTLRSAQSIIGCFNFAAFAIPLGWLHLRPIQLASHRLPRKFPHRPFVIPHLALSEFRWWLLNLKKSTPLFPPKTQTFISTDASDLGWGAVVAGNYFQGRWSHRQRSWHINLKELFAVRAAITLNQSLLSDNLIIVYSDNKTVVAYIRNQGGPKSLSLFKETKKLFDLISMLGIHIIPHFIQGRLNSLADSLSRQTPVPEWHLLPSYTKQVFRRWGTPEIDLFASSRSRVVPTYVSRNPLDLKAEFIDAFSRIWNFRLAWVFPPPPVIPQVLRHLNRSSSESLFLVVSPRWNKVFWRADLKGRAIAPPLIVSNLQSHLIDLATQRPPPRIDDLILEIWLIRGGPPKSKGGRRKKNICYRLPGDHQLSPHIGNLGPVGFPGPQLTQ